MVLRSPSCGPSCRAWLKWWTKTPPRPSSIEKAIDVLFCFDLQRPQLRLVDISQRLGLHKSTAHRLLSLLKKKGLVVVDPTTQLYSLGPALVELAWFPVAILVQLILTLGFALLLSALTVHFRDVRDILGHVMMFWFFITPIIYPYFQMEPWQMRLLNANPMTHLTITYQEILYFNGPVGHWKWLLAVGAASVVFFLFGYFVFDRLRDTFAEEV